MKVIPWYFRWLGFNYRYITKIYNKSLAIQLDSTHWLYTGKLLDTYLYWFNFKIKVI